MEAKTPKPRHKLELFISEDCLSLQPAMQLYADLSLDFPDLSLDLVDHLKNSARAEEAGVFIIPSFVLDGRVISVGLPSREEISRSLREALSH